MSRRAQRSQQQPGGEPARPARRSRARGRVAKALLLGGVVALAARPEVRNRLLDMLFGPEEQFEYDSVTEPLAPPIIPDQGGEDDTAWADGTGATESWPTSADDSSTAGAEEEPASPDGPLRAGAEGETPPPAIESWTAPAAEEEVAPAETPTVVHEPWSPGEESATATEQSAATATEGEEMPTVVSEPWSAGEASAAVPEETPTVVSEPWSAGGASGAVPEETPAVVSEPWSAGGASGAVPEEAPVVYEPWSPSEQGAAGGEDEPELIAYQEASWLSSPDAESGGDGTAWVEPTEDFEAERVEPSAVSTLDEAEPAGEESPQAEADGAPEEAEAEAQQQQQPAIGEAESPRSGWWMPRRRRPDGGSREPPRWD